MKSKLIYIALILIGNSGLTIVNAQETNIAKGVVMEKGSPSRIAAAEIQNKRTGLRVQSNNFGLFQISALAGDTLVIFKQDYMDVQLPVTPGKDMLVYLNRGTTLSQVNIYGQSKKQELDGMKQEYRDKGSFYAGKPPLLSYVFTPLTALYELFGRTPKNAKRFNKFYNTELQQSDVDRYFNQSLIQKHTDLKDKDLETFMLNYRPDYEIVQKWTDYDAIKYIRDAYKKYTDTLKK